jgi:hypothetical protein
MAEQGLMVASQLKSRPMAAFFPTRQRCDFPLCWSAAVWVGIASPCPKRLRECST